MIDELTLDNYILFAAKHYWSIHYSVSEFESDLYRIIYIKRLLNKYNKTGVIHERLLLNQLILLFNVFSPVEAVNKMLFFRINEESYPSLKTFLVYLDRMSDTIMINNSKIIRSTDITIDMNIANLLRVL